MISKAYSMPFSRRRMLLPSSKPEEMLPPRKLERRSRIRPKTRMGPLLQRNLKRVQSRTRAKMILIHWTRIVAFSLQESQILPKLKIPERKS